MWDIIWSLFDLAPKDWSEWGAYATMLAVFVNAAFLYFLIQQVREAQRSSKAAEKAADAAQKSVREAMYARIDQQAPRVIALLDQPTLGGVQSPHEISWQADYKAVLPRDGDKHMYVGVTGTLVNEGKSTARVRLNGNGARWIENEDDEPLIIGPVTSSGEERILSPGQKVRFLWSESHTIKDWADSYNNPSPPNPHGACFMEVIVRDYFEEGVIDHIFLEMSGRPLVPVEGDAGHWHVPDKPEFAAVSYPIERAHRFEENANIIPPWAEVYKERSEQN